ncbi:3-isopropylmalate dehydrogenase [Marinicella meishanensis]|uniref:3-isopropylmalate dehydrogenase n=1 Tax=Marinicella meishanensis TaxID=2873263 RepID=UPI001CBFCB86|nr:3-isopropylmalate dehydrogenase [Marinicella sp. NBU2979]
MSRPRIAVLPGDGIGPEVMQQTLRLLAAVAPDVEPIMGLIGGAAYVKHQAHFPAATRDLIDDSDAVLFGSVGGPIEQAHLPQWRGCEVNSILALRQHLGVFINHRPARIFPALRALSPLKNERLEACGEVLILRELLGDVYFGKKRTFKENGCMIAEDVATYTEHQITQMAHQAFQTAAARGGQLCSVDKANVLDTSRLWRQVFTAVATDYPTVQLQHMLVDNCAMQLILNPAQFSVIATSNLFGDILSDAASALPGSLGMMPSASFNATGFGLYEPAGGSAPELTGKDVANPMAQMLSLAMLLRHSLDRPAAAAAIEQAIEATLDQGHRTPDLMAAGGQPVGTTGFTDQVLRHLP